jgi:hypothetical protein
MDAMRHLRSLVILGTLLAVGLAAAQQAAQPPAAKPQAKQKKGPKQKVPEVQPKAEGKFDPVADQIAADERVLQAVKEKTDGPSLLTYLKKRTYPEADPKRVAHLVRELGDRSFVVREKAQSDLIDLGPSALAAVKEAETATDWEVRKRAIDIRRRIEQKADPVVQSAVARLIAARKPDGAAIVLLNYLPFAADESVIDEISRALTEVAVKDGKADAAVVAALTDKLSVKRGAAGAALVNGGAKGQLAAARKLLDDKEPAVQLRVALALASRERDRRPSPG